MVPAADGTGVRKKITTEAQRTQRYTEKRLLFLALAAPKIKNPFSPLCSWCLCGGFLSAFQSVDLAGEAGDFPGGSAPMQGAFAGDLGDDGHRLDQRGLSAGRVFLSYSLPHFPHHAFHPGLAALVPQMPFLILPGPLQRGNMSSQIIVLRKNCLVNLTQ
jgi:hypothetical protein